MSMIQLIALLDNNGHIRVYCIVGRHIYLPSIDITIVILGPPEMQTICPYAVGDTYFHKFL